uniref:ATP synthase F0 subunit 8 n=1 Tax=Nerodia sipedon TaxID=8592 RepID=F8UX93_9SAUR|nr:ATP synthase F0 subunit 8 [Nerodia sipedon]AEH59654.1 ATP synthase F0 subunit 8 [Nerodia sipedon]
MPQLDTIFILAVFTWAWSVLCLTMKKISSILMTSGPKKHSNIKKMKQSPALPWT